MRTFIYLRDSLVLVGVITLIIFSIDAYNVVFSNKTEQQSDVFDWNVVDKFSNQDKSVIAVIERGISNSDVNTAPFYRIELRVAENSSEWKKHWTVWNSQSNQPPSIKWIDQNSIEIKQLSDRVWEYVPSIELNGKTYLVYLNVLPTEP